MTWLWILITLAVAYAGSKFLAERAILEAALDGLDVKIMRVGNLMARDADGEFQAAIAQAFAAALKGEVWRVDRHRRRQFLGRVALGQRESKGLRLGAGKGHLQGKRAAGQRRERGDVTLALAQGQDDESV